MSSLNDLRQFHQFVGTQIDHGRALSPEDALDEWRHLHGADDDLGAIQEAIEDMENGARTIPFEDFDRDFRRQRGLPPQS